MSDYNDLTVELEVHIDNFEMNSMKKAYDGLVNAYLQHLPFLAKEPLFLFDQKIPRISEDFFRKFNFDDQDFVQAMITHGKPFPEPEIDCELLWGWADKDPAISQFINSVLNLIFECELYFNWVIDEDDHWETYHVRLTPNHEGDHPNVSIEIEYNTDEN